MAMKLMVALKLKFTQLFQFDVSSLAQELYQEECAKYRQSNITGFEIDFTLSSVTDSHYIPQFWMLDKTWAEIVKAIRRNKPASKVFEKSKAKLLGSSNSHSKDASVHQEQERCICGLEYTLHVLEQILPILCAKKGNGEEFLRDIIYPVMDPMTEMTIKKVLHQTKNTDLALVFAMKVHEDIARILDVENICSNGGGTKSLLVSTSEASSFSATLKECREASADAHDIVLAKRYHHLQIVMRKSVLGHLDQCAKMLERGVKHNSEPTVRLLLKKFRIFINFLHQMLTIASRSRIC
jgi:hypothetical protein